MKFNKIIMGLGMASLMLTSCDKAAEQNYTAAPAVATPPAYFSVDYDPDVILEELQTEFSIPCFRADAGPAASFPVDVTVTTNAHADGLFSVLEGYDAAGDPTGTPININSKLTSKVTFEEGSNEGKISFFYPWSEMEQLPGVEFNFELALNGADTEYFLTDTKYVVMYVPWMNPEDPETGETTCYFKDDLVYSGWRLTGYPTPFSYEVEIQYNPIALEKGQLIYRCQTPYANLGHFGSSDDSFFFDGYNADGSIIKNVMFINATDPHNVYLCDKNGNPTSSIYNTYYVISPDYGHVGYLDRCAAYELGENCVFGPYAYKNSGGDASLNGYMNDEGNKIIFPEGHFFVCMLATDDAITTGNQLEIWLPGAKEEVEWEDLGMCEYTDGLAWWLIEGEELTYEVPIQQNIKDPNLFQIICPYTDNWPDGNEQDDKYNFTIDCTNKDCVLFSLGYTGLDLPDGANWYENMILNAGNLYQNYMKSGSEWTAAQVIEEGINDTYDAETGVINLSHMVIDFIISDDEEDLVELWEEGAPGIKIQLPAPAGAPRYALRSSQNKPGKRIAAQSKRWIPNVFVKKHMRVK